MTTDEILNSLNEEQELHIVVGSNRKITVPESLKKIAVQNDHDVNTITFDCPRYSDGRDMSEMVAYINYRLPDNTLGSYPAENMRVDEDDDSIIHFDWTIKREITYAKGNLDILVCIKNTDENGNEINHWNSDLNKELYVSEGLECELFPVDDPRNDILTSVLLRVSNVEEENKKLEEQIASLDGRMSDLEEIAGSVKEGTLALKGEIEESELPTEGNITGDVYKFDSPGVEKEYVVSHIQHYYWDEETGSGYYYLRYNVSYLMTEQEQAEWDIFEEDMYADPYDGQSPVTFSVDFYDVDWKYIGTEKVTYNDGPVEWVFDIRNYEKPDWLELDVDYYLVRTDGAKSVNNLQTHKFEAESSLDAADYAIFNGESFDKFYSKETIDKKMGNVETVLDLIIALQESYIGGDAV